MPRRQILKLSTGRGVRGKGFARVFNLRTGETYRYYGLRRLLSSGKVSKVRPKIRRKK